MPKAEIRLEPNVSYMAKAVLLCLTRAVECQIISSDDTPVSELETLKELEHLHIETYVLHNGRENGYCLVATHGYTGPAMLVFFAEHRNTDSLFVQIHETKSAPFNGPTINDFSEESYRRRRKMFGAKYEEAAEHIVNEIAKFYVEQVKAHEAHKAKRAS